MSLPTPGDMQVTAGSVRQPRYRSIAAELHRRIANQDYAPGELLPSEVELANEFGVTRMTVRQALTGMVNDGMLVRRQGVGIPEATNVVARYPIAVLRHASNTAVAGDFVDFVLSARGQQVLAGFGFLGK